MNFAEPSAIRTLHPPEWLLLALAYEELSGLHPRQEFLQDPQAYCAEFGGTTVLNTKYAVAPTIHHCPRLSARPLLPVVKALNDAVQVFRSVWAWPGFAKASARVIVGALPVTPLPR
jgi:hypothetical protein